MPNPKRRHSKSRRDKRRANWRLEVPNLALCPECHEPKLPHHICLSCGSYKGRKILEIVEKEVV